MRLTTGVVAAASLSCSALIGSSDAFVVPRRHAFGGGGAVPASSGTALRVGDEDAALMGMGGQGEMTGDMGGMPDPKYVPKEGDAEADERSQGGNRFRAMMEQSKSGGGRPQSRPQSSPQPAVAAVQPEDPYDPYAQQAQVQQQPQAQAHVPPPPPGVPLPPGWASTVDPNSGRTYYYNQATQETSWTPPPMPPPPPPPMPPQQGQVAVPPPQGGPRVVRSGPSGDPTDTGVNDNSGLRVPTLEEQFRDNVKKGRRELDTISSAADVYLAQLKRDTTIRKFAQMSGDVEKSNEVFTDPSIQELEGWVHKNPYTEEENEELWAMVGTSEDEMIGYFDEPDDGMTEEERRSYSGISYKEKMAEMRRARKQKKGGD